jgi:hypothetical protein
VIRAVLNTNTIVSGVGWGGPPGAVLDAALAGHFEIVTSPALLDELRRVLSYPKLQAVIGDPDDDRLIEAALAANADVIGRPGPAHPGALSARSRSGHPESSSSLSTWAPDSRQPGREQLWAEATLTTPAHHHGCRVGTRQP